jgi:hypothetical protein
MIVTNLRLTPGPDYCPNGHCPNGQVTLNEPQARSDRRSNILDLSQDRALRNAAQSRLGTFVDATGEQQCLD